MVCVHTKSGDLRIAAFLRLLNVASGIGYEQARGPVSTDDGAEDAENAKAASGAGLIRDCTLRSAFYIF